MCVCTCTACEFHEVHDIHEIQKVYDIQEALMELRFTIKYMSKVFWCRECQIMQLQSSVYSSHFVVKPRNLKELLAGI